MKDEARKDLKAVNISKRNNVTIIGEGQQTIVFAHGFGCDQKMWQYITPFFEKDYRLILFDYVGSGESAYEQYNEQKYKTLHGYKQDLLDVLASEHLQDCIYIGHSVSSMIGVLAANEQPALFKQIIMIGPSPKYLNEGDYIGGFTAQDIDELLTMMEMNFTGWASFMAPFALGVEQEAPVTQELHQTFMGNNPVIARQFAEATFYSDHRHDLLTCTIPTFVLQCEEDSIVPIHVGRYIQEQMPNCLLQVIAIKGHYPHIVEPKLTSEYILNYLKQ